MADHALALLTKTVDAGDDLVTGLEIHRLRLHAESDTCRRAGAEHIARAQRHELARVADQSRHADHHVRRRAFLPGVAVDRQPDAEIARVSHVVARDKHWTERRE